MEHPPFAPSPEPASRVARAGAPASRLPISLALLALAVSGPLQSGCEPPRPPCIGPPQGTHSITTSLVTAEPILKILRLDGAGRFPAAEMIAEVTAEEPILIVDTAPGYCPSAGPCLRLRPEEIRDAGPATSLSGPGRPSVVGRYPAGETVRLDLLAHGSLHVIRPEALTSATPRKITVTTRLTAAECAPRDQRLSSPWADWAIEAAAPSGCGDGIVQGSEPCDDGNTTSGDGCDVERDSVCRVSPPACEPDRAGQWHAFRCEGRPSRCARVECRSGEDNPPECGAPIVYADIAKGGVDARVGLVVDGRTKVPVRVEVRTGHGDDVCGCLETGLRHDCDPSCTIPMPCARVTAPPQASGLTWNGIEGKPSSAAGYQLDNLSAGSFALGSFSTGQSGVVGPALSLSPGTHESLQLTAHTAAPEGTEWFAVLSERSPPYQRFEREASLRRVRGEETIDVPAVTSAEGRYSSIAHLAADPDGRGVWMVSQVEGRPAWRNGLLAAGETSADGVRHVLVHASDAGALLGFAVLPGSAAGSPVGQALAAPPRAGSPFQAALLSVDAAGELSIAAFDGRAKEIWRRSIGPVKGRYVDASHELRLSVGPGGKLWAYFDATRGFESRDFQGRLGAEGRQIVIFEADGKLAERVSARLIAWTPSPDGRAMWSLEGEPGKLSLHLRKRDIGGRVLVEHALDVEEAPATWDLLSLPNEEVVIVRQAYPAGVVVSRWEVGANSLRSRWLERAPIHPSAPLGGMLDWDEGRKAIRVVGGFHGRSSGTIRTFLRP